MSQTYSPDPPATSRIRALLLAVWLACTLGAVAFVLTFGSNAPYADEWRSVPALLGEEAAGPWLWALHNEHRLPLPRAIYLAVFRLTHDFRTGMLLQVLLLSALSLGLMRVAARLRGRPARPDAFFPISLLHLGHWENLLMGSQLCFALFPVLVMGLAVVALGATRATAFRSGVRAGGLLLLAALTSGAGVALVVPVGAWLAYLALLVWRQGEKGHAAAILAVAALPLAYLGVYLVGYGRPAHHPTPSTDPVAVALTTGVVLSLAVGVGVAGVWWAVAAAEVLLGLATGALLLSRPAAERPPAIGLLAVAAGLGGVALAIGSARAAWGVETVGVWSRYSLLAWPLLGAAFLVWVKAGGRGGRWVPALLCVAAALALPTNTGTGILVGNSIRKHYDQVAADSRANLPADKIVSRHFPDSMNAGEMEAAVRAVPLLQAAGVGIFAQR